jgi:hypothetical protein
MNAEIIGCGKSKKDEPGFQYKRPCCRDGNNRIRAGQGGGFDWGPKAQEGVQRSENASEGQEALAVQPFGKKAGEVAFSRFSPFHIFSVKVTVTGFFPWDGRPALSRFPPMGFFFMA